MTILLLIYLFILIIFLIKDFSAGFAIAIILDLLVVRKGYIDVGVQLPFREIVFITVLFFYIFHQQRSNKRKYNINFSFLIVFFTLSTLMGLFLSNNYSTSGQIKHLIGLLYYFIYGYIAWTWYDCEKEIQKFSSILFLFSTLISLYGLCTYIFKANPYMDIFGNDLFHNYENIEDRGALGMRVQSTTVHPITWGGTCFLLFLYFIREQKKNKYHYILLVLLLINIILCGSRTAILIILIYPILRFFTVDIREKKKFIKIALILLIFFLIIIQLPELQKYKGILESTLFFWDDSIASSNDIQGSSITMRLMQYAGLMDLISDNILWGMGHGYVNYYLSTYGQHPILLGFESLIFNKSVEGGIVGLITWIYLFYYLYRKTKCLNKYDKMSDLSNLKCYVMCYFIFALLTGFMNTFQLFLILYVIQFKYILTSNTINNKAL